MPFYASFNNVLSLCMIMAVIALFVGRSQSFASPHFVLSMSSTRASNSQKPSYSNVSTIQNVKNRVHIDEKWFDMTKKKSI
jgi:hypothetical protein